MAPTRTTGSSDHLFTLDPPRVYPVLERADGVHVWDTDGNQYLDAVAGLGVVNIGYGRTEVARRDRRPGGEDAVQRRQHLLERARDRACGAVIAEHDAG